MIHKTKKEEGKKHITMPLRCKFQIFRPDSRPILACFGCFRPIWVVLAVSVAGRYDLIWPNQLGSARIKPSWLELSRVSANPRKKKKKKKTQTQSDARATASDAGAAPLVPRPCFLGFRLPLNIDFLSKAFETQLIDIGCAFICF